MYRVPQFLRVITGRSDYRISCASDLDLDIPAPLSSVSRYCATLGHKTCHSFTPNSVFQQLWHPRHGECLNTVKLGCLSIKQCPQLRYFSNVTT